MQPTPTNKLIDFLEHEVLSNSEISIAVDAHLNYLVVNDAAAKSLGRQSWELIGSNIVELYPSIIASKNHRNLLKASNGELIENDLVKNRLGELFVTTYQPIIIDHQVKAIIIVAKPYNG